MKAYDVCKKLLFVLILAVLAAVLLALPVRAQSGICGELQWTLSKDGVLTISGSGVIPDYNTPGQEYKEQVRQVVIEEGVTGIGRFVFQNFASLESVQIADTVTFIEDQAFRFCNALTEIRIPKAVSFIAPSVFNHCPALTGIWVSPDNPYYSSDEYGVLFNKDQTMLEHAPGALSGTYKVPEGVRYILENAFYQCTALTQVYLPDGLCSIGESAFQGCTGLRAIVMPDSVVSIGDGVFADCTRLASVKLSGGLTHVGTRMFYNCRALTGITIPDGVKTIRSSAFVLSGLKTIMLPEGVVAIGEAAFMCCKNLSSAYFPESLRDVSSHAFYACGALKDVYYRGSAAQWSSISVVDKNEDLTGATIHYNWVDTPKIVTLENLTGGIKLTWNAVPGAERYRVYVKTSTGWLNLGHTTGTSFIYAGAKSGYTYTFTVRCVNGANNAFTSSFCAAGWRQKFIASPKITKLENVNGGIKLTWNAVPGAERYRVYVKTSTGWLNLGHTTGTSFVYAGAKSGYTYTFTVRCVNGGNNAFTSSFYAAGWRQKFIASPKITKLENVNGGIKLTWNAVPGAERYRVYVKTDAGWKNIGTTAGNGFTWTEAKAGQTYIFTVRCVNAANNAFTSSFNAAGWSIKRY